MPFQNISNEQLDRDFHDFNTYAGDADLMRLICQKAQRIAHKEAITRGDLSREALFQLANLMVGFHISGWIDGIRYGELCNEDGSIKARYRAYFIHHFTYQYCLTLIAKAGGLTQTVKTP